MDPNLILLIGGGLGVALLLVGVGVSLLGGQTAVEERLGRYAESGGLVTSAAGTAAPKVERKTIVGDFLNRMGEGTDLFDGISKNLARADIKLRPAEFMGLIVIAAIGAFFVGTILGRSIIFGILVGAFGAFAPQIYVRRAQAARLRQFDSQLGDMLNLMVNGLRAGFSTLQAMEAVSRELPAPICDEFRRVVQEMQLGIAMEEALDHLLRRINSDDLDLVITAINVQREVGGNLAEILDVISFTIRERVRIKGEISALTAQGRATAWVISLLPVVLVLLLFLLNRPYIMQFFNPETRTCGIPLLSLATIMVLSGFYAVQKIVAIDI
ncbi:MAG TPA: type II secretion system F family protein [Anaerolineales bacterium]|nr:type II secretion system F family protein [Anaerolineales bacterium]